MSNLFLLTTEQMAGCSRLSGKQSPGLFSDPPNFQRAMASHVSMTGGS